MFDIHKKIVGLSIKRGRKRYAEKEVMHAYRLINQLTGLDAILFLKLAIYKLTPLFKLYKFTKKRRIAIICRFLHPNLRLSHCLRAITTHAFQNITMYSKYSQSLAISILSYAYADASIYAPFKERSIESLKHKRLMSRRFNPRFKKKKYVNKYRLVRKLKYSS